MNAAGPTAVYPPPEGYLIIMTEPQSHPPLPEDATLTETALPAAAGTSPVAPAAPVVPPPRAGRPWLRIILIVLVTMLLTAVVTAWGVSRYLFQKEFKPVALKPKEEQALNIKLEQIGLDAQSSQPGGATLEPEAYSERGARREVAFSEREVNALLAKNTDLAQRLAIDLSENLISAKLLVPMDPDFPMLGGKTLRVNAGAELAFADGRPRVVLKGVSVMGVPVPNAWLGNLKNIDLVKEFGGEAGFWKTFADGVENIQIVDGRLVVKLKE